MSSCGNASANNSCCDRNRRVDLAIMANDELKDAAEKKVAEEG